MQQVGQSRPDYGLLLSHFSVKVFQTIEVVPSPLARGLRPSSLLHFGNTVEIEGFIASQFKGRVIKFAPHKAPEPISWRRVER